MINLQQIDQYSRQYSYYPNNTNDDQRIISFYSEYGLEQKILSFEINEQALVSPLQKKIIIVRQNYYLQTLEIHMCEIANLSGIICKCCANKINKIDTVICIQVDFTNEYLIAASFCNNDQEILILTTNQILRFRTQTVINQQNEPLFSFHFTQQLNINIHKKKHLLNICESKIVLFDQFGQYIQKCNKIVFQCLSIIIDSQKKETLKRITFNIKYEFEIIDENATLESFIKSIIYENQSQTYLATIMIQSKEKQILQNAIFDQNFKLLELNTQQLLDQ